MPKFRPHDHLNKAFGGAKARMDREGRIHFFDDEMGFRRPMRVGPVEKPVKPFSVLPPEFEAVRDRYSEWKKNPGAFIDMSTLEERGDGTFIVKSSAFKQLGSGMYSDVYEIDDKHVLKVVKRYDSGYANFVSIVAAHPNNPHFPKILFDGEWEGKQVYILERLSDQASGSWAHRELARIVQKLARGNADEYLSGDNPYIRVSLPQSLKDAAKAIENCCSDLHSGNIMWRGDVLVITDPDC